MRIMRTNNLHIAKRSDTVENDDDDKQQLTRYCHIANCDTVENDDDDK